VTREGIRGLELNKMSEGPINPWHNAALPFTRYIVGHADYTPFTVDPKRMGPTTISHQLASLVCFTSVLQTIAENPERLLQPEFNELVAVLKQIPSVWDETKVLSGSKIGDLAVMARRKGSDWFIAALNGSGSRDYRLDLSFLDDKKYAAVLTKDHTSLRTQFQTDRIEVNRHSIIDIKMLQGGGFVLLLSPKE
jgi:alpha-glucosidase